MMLSKKAMGKRFGLLAALLAALVIACTGVVLAQSSTASGVSAATKVKNGGFETGDFSGWRRANWPVRSGNWFVYSGTTSPLETDSLERPPQGRFAATTDQRNPGSHVLYKNIRLKRGMKHKLSFYLYYRNHGPFLFARFYTPNTLNPRNRPNQQYRVDILKPSAKPFTVKKKAVLARLFRTEVYYPNKPKPKILTFNLTRFAGKTVRLRFAEVDNEANLLASVDKVKVTSKRR
jgi:hypothetical protein